MNVIVLLVSYNYHYYVNFCFLKNKLTKAYKKTYQSHAIIKIASFADIKGLVSIYTVYV